MPISVSLRQSIRRVSTAFVLAAIIVGLAGIYALMRKEFADARELEVTAARTVATRDLLSDLLVVHLDAESAARGYAVSGDSSFLEHYRSSLTGRLQIFSAIEETAGREITPHLPELRAKSDQRFAHIASVIADVDNGGTALARQRIAKGEGLRVMMAVRQGVAQLDRMEIERLERLLRATAHTRGNIQRSLALTLVAIALLLGLLVLLVSRSMRERYLALERAERIADRERAMFDGAVDGMLLLDEQGHIMRMNPSISRMFGFSESHLLGRSNMYLMDEEFSVEQSLAWLGQVAEAGAEGAGRRQEFIGRRADGSTFETEVAISRVKSAGGRRYIAAIRDISDRKHTERMKSEFVSTVSHELRTPLTSIGGSLGLLAAGAVGALDEKAARLVAIAHSNCERLIRLINDILDIEKIESGKMAFDMRRMNLAPLIERTVNANRQFAQDHSVELEVAVPAWPQCVIGDPDRLEQVLTNLVSNAIKHSPAGGTVEIVSSQQNGRAVVEVRDRGGGVPKEFRGRIFSKFAMADSSDSRKRSGTGLGLVIAREIAERHGGAVDYADREGGGSVFHIRLPLAHAESQPPVAQETGLPVLLHIDDDFDCLSVVASAFAGRADIHSVTSVAAAREAVTQRAFDGAIVDVAMGDESGLILLPELRAAAPDLPVVLFTAVEDLHADARADAVIVKSRSSMGALVEATMALVGRERKGAR